MTINTSLIDAASVEFTEAFNAFKETGDFLALTQPFEQGLTNQENAALEFPLTQATAKLLDTGVLVIEPNELAQPLKNIVISSGIHGNETAPIEIVNQMLKDIVQGRRIVAHRTLFIIGNPVSMNISKRFSVENLNRLFCGKYKDIAPCYEKERAEKLESYVSNFFNHVGSSFAPNAATTYHYDLHTAIRPSKHEKFAIYPYQGDKPWDKEQLAFMRACGVNTILFGHAPSGTFSYFSSANFSAHAFTVELGKVRGFGENDMSKFADAYNTLSAFVSNEAINLKAFDNADFNLFKVLGDITKYSDDFKLNIADDVSNFTGYPAGTLLAEDEKNYQTTHDGESIVFPNANVGINQRAALMVIPCEL